VIKISEYAHKIKEELKKSDELPEEIKKDFDPIAVLDNLFQPQDEKEKDKIIEILFEHEDLRKISDISHNQLVDIVALKTFSDYIQSPLIKKFCEHYLALSLSKGRKSREEVVEIYRTNMMSELGYPFIPEKQSRFQRLRERLNL